MHGEMYLSRTAAAPPPQSHSHHVLAGHSMLSEMVKACRSPDFPSRDTYFKQGLAPNFDESKIVDP